MHRTALACLIALTVAAAGFAGEDAADEDAATLDTVQKRASYIFGLQFASMMQQQGLDLKTIDAEAMLLAVQDVAERKQPRLNQEQMQQTIQAYQADMKKKAEARGAANKKAGEEFLAANAKQEDVKTTDSGLQYKVLEEGKGEEVQADDNVTVHYTGKTLDGEVFDSSRERGEPITFELGRVIQGWQEGLQLMRVGSRYKLFIPGDLAYGERGGPGGPNSTLIFDVEVLDTEHKTPEGEGGGKADLELPGM